MTMHLLIGGGAWLFLAGVVAYAWGLFVGKGLTEEDERIEQGRRRDG